MPFRPLADRVVIRPDPAETTSRGGIIIADTLQQKPKKGTVISVGPGARKSDGTLVPTVIQPGDRVIYGNHSTIEVKVDNEDVLIMPEHNILGTAVE